MNEKRIFRSGLVSVQLLLAHLAIAVTPGWENVNPQRREVAPAKVLWTADISSACAFKIVKR